jgi:hypothetical protein
VLSASVTVARNRCGPIGSVLIVAASSSLRERAIAADSDRDRPAEQHERKAQHRGEEADQ